MTLLHRFYSVPRARMLVGAKIHASPYCLPLMQFCLVGVYLSPLFGRFLCLSSHDGYMTRAPNEEILISLASVEAWGAELGWSDGSTNRVIFNLLIRW